MVFFFLIALEPLKTGNDLMTYAPNVDLDYACAHSNHRLHYVWMSVCVLFISIDYMCIKTTEIAVQDDVVTLVRVCTGRVQTLKKSTAV